ncbi:hypothetical protein PRIPAC_76631 [Pristionchus pacificus]|uniref:Carboxylic ester hydrolase n=1 Tax=Pristionchus pacificus TaxID=54126 RepID=A0A2A6CZL5_PRIPA|nr:hypothetical protein PRIPAC_76631 [Pristionchus pacificus]|eukprot:PDM83546.1 hydrolase [Pristionchus pacificus]
MLFILLFFLQALSSSSISNFPIVSTSFGSIRGYEYKNDAAFTAQIFKKLPFASPPIGDLRWRKPQSPSKWNTTIDGTFFGPACAQRTLMYAGPITGFSEDCLHVNVYTNEKCRTSSSCSVIFIIHGGLGIYESTMKFPDETLVTNFVSQDIVVVTTAYRVGAFGIMALGDENALPANLAMHDVLAALKFTRDEIHAFGGDKESITIMGHSTGAQIALNFAFSPGISPPGVPRLFSSVISMSGPLGLEKEEKQVERSHLVANLLKCSGTAREIIACMKKKTTDEILDAAFDVQEGDIFNERGLIGLMMGGELMPIRSARELRENNQPIRMMIGTTLYETKNFGLYNSTEVDEDKVNRVLGIDNDEECFEKYLDDTKSREFVTEHSTDSQALFMTAYSLAKEQSESGGEVRMAKEMLPMPGIEPGPPG